MFGIKLCSSYCILIILNYCLPNTFDVSIFNYERLFGSANIFLSTVNARITFTWQSAWPWKNRTIPTHIKMERKSKLWMQVDRVFLAKKKKKKTSKQLQFVCDLNHYIAERQWKYNFLYWHNQSYDSTNDFLYVRKQILWFLHKSWWVMIPQMMLSSFRTS